MKSRRPGCTSSARDAACSNSGRQPDTDSALARVIGKSRPGQMHLRQRLADAGAMRGVRLARPDAFEKIDDRRRPAGQRAAALRRSALRPAAGN